ncbi:unnamed protein product [Moneuplotes crassus]|uniref:Uncharacterized protein n=1 Tax=Euplotes crassus TaxID=5936 RepID=A0AAD1XUK6_EUPCR|nr:unnamed protein product [Moneuplotes crassus]
MGTFVQKRLFKVLTLLLIMTTILCKSSSRSGGYRRTYSSSRTSGTSSTGTCTGSTMKCVIIPLCIFAGFILIILIIIGIFHGARYAKKMKKKYREFIQNREKKNLKEKQLKEASRLEKLHQENKNNLHKNLYPEIPNSYPDFGYQASTNNIIMPGTSGYPDPQPPNPSYPNPVPVIYNPSQYGVRYDQTVPSAPPKRPTKEDYVNPNPYAYPSAFSPAGPDVVTNS